MPGLVIPTMPTQTAPSKNALKKAKQRANKQAKKATAAKAADPFAYPAGPDGYEEEHDLDAPDTDDSSPSEQKQEQLLEIIRQAQRKVVKDGKGLTDAKGKCKGGWGDKKASINDGVFGSNYSNSDDAWTWKQGWDQHPEECKQECLEWAKKSERERNYWEVPRRRG